MMKYKFLFLILACASIPAAAQNFTMKRIELADQKVILHYDLTDTVVNRSYTLNLYSSQDNFLNPLQKTTGDIGMEVKPGLNKKITWDATSELGPDFDGNVAFEIRGRLYVPFIRISGFDEYKVIKRGKEYAITWSGGTPQNILNFDLYKGDKKVNTFANIANVGHNKLTLPTDTKPGKDYRLRISDTKNKDEVVTTGTFTVKRKVPLLMKILPLAAVAYIITLFGDDDPKEIPDPIDP